MDDQLQRDAEECNLMDQLALDDDDEDNEQILNLYSMDTLLSDLGKEDDDKYDPSNDPLDGTNWI